LSAEFRAALKPLQGKGSDLANADAPFTTDAGAAGIVPPAARIGGTGDQLVLDPAQNNSFRVLARAMNDGATASFDNGRYVLSGTGIEKAVAHAEELGLRAERRAASAGGAAVRNRVAIYKSFTASMDEGWTEWLLDSWGFKYTILNNSDIQAGDLNSKYDVILFASDRAGSITDGFAKGTVPPRYEGGIGDADALGRPAGSAIAGDFVCVTLFNRDRRAIGQGGVEGGQWRASACNTCSQRAAHGTKSDPADPHVGWAAYHGSLERVPTAFPCLGLLVNSETRHREELQPNLLESQELKR
jgi:hypothetical protein